MNKAVFVYFVNSKGKIKHRRKHFATRLKETRVLILVKLILSLIGSFEPLSQPMGAEGGGGVRDVSQYNLPQNPKWEIKVTKML